MEQAAAYLALKEKLKNREWRLDNLYWIQDAHGNAVKFVRNAAQLSYWNNLWYRNAILKARRLGFSTFIALLELDNCLFNSNTAAGVIDLTMDDAEDKLAKARFAYERLPQMLQAAVPLTKANTRTLEFGNGSSISVGTSHRGGTLQVLHVSEFGKISAEYPRKAREIKTGAFSAVHAGEMVHVESTAEGNAGEFYDLVQRADAMQKEGRELSSLDYRLHFFPWWQHPEHRLPPHLVTITAEMAEYFAELEGKHRIVLGTEQKAWYVAKRKEVGPDDMFREFPSIADEAFFSSVEGAYFKREMTKARLDGRIGLVPHDENRKVNTFWDIGNDCTAIWFHQTDGMRHRLIDYYENSNEGIAHYVKALQEKKDKRGFLYGTHYGPHDIEVADWGGEGKTRKDKAAGLGLEFEVIPRVDDKDDAIEEARSFIGNSWIDAEHCDRGIQCLDSYRKKWDEARATWKNDPFHDWASHGADSLMTGAMGFSPEAPAKTARDRHRAGRGEQRSAWGV